MENDKLTDYLLAEWGVEIAQKVAQLIEDTADRIRRNPEHFPIFIKGKKIRRCVVSPQTSIFFKVNKDEIFIISLFDNRQSPRKRRL